MFTIEFWIGFIVGSVIFLLIGIWTESKHMRNIMKRYNLIFLSNKIYDKELKELK